jgi:hypothetical protein
MKQSVRILVAIVATCAGLALSRTAYADAPSPATLPNQVTLDITINSSGEMTVGGLSLKALGLGPIDSQATQVASNLNSAHLVLQGDVISVDVHGTPFVKMQWTPASRQVVANLAAKYGYTISPDIMARIEEWATSSSLDITARYTNETSKPLTINLTKPFLVDVGPEGQVAIEKGPLAYGIDPRVMQTIKQSGVRNTAMCWNKGTLIAKVDGNNLPSLTVYPKGLEAVSQALNLRIDNDVDPLFGSQLGVDVNLPGGAHQTGTACGN